jgi:hypothetical protein
MTFEKRESILKLVGKIIADIHIKEMRAKQESSPPAYSDETP